MKSLKKLIITTFYLLFFSFTTSAQNIGINTTGTNPDNSALLDLSSSDKGFLITRADTLDIASPAFGLMTLSPKDSCLYMQNGKSSGKTWISIGGVGKTCNVEESSFSCGLPFTDERDSKTYQTVQIGNQCWMSENLNFATNSGSWCYEENDANCDIYGRLYNWTTATNSASSNTNPSGVQGVCPTAWHLPSDDEWKELEVFIGIPQTDIDNTGWRGTDEGDKLKTSAWGGNNSSGFTALPGGSRIIGFGSLGSDAFWWSATESGSYAFRRYLTKSRKDMYRDSNGKAFGHSVRCVQD